MALDRFFRPRSVAVVGAAREPGKVGHEVLANLIAEGGFAGSVYPVNPAATEILGLRCFASLADVPEHIDLAIIVVPARTVPGIIGECVATGITAAIVISAGFREAGPVGAALEREMLEIAHAGGVRVLGPNCLGLVSTPTALNASFATVLPPRGRIAFFSQSGALGTAILDWAAGEGLGISHFVSLGNRADLSESDFLDEWANDSDTAVIAGYLESVTDGPSFLRSATAAARRKPVIMLKSGASDAGARAVSSHTGSLAGSDTAYGAAFQACGVVRAATVEELFDLASVYARQPLPTGPGMAILTNAGGPAVIATDMADGLECSLASFDMQTIDRLRALLPDAASIYNPVDILGDAGPERFSSALDVLVADPAVRSLLVIATPQAMTDPLRTATEVVRIAEATTIPIVTSFMGAASVTAARALLRDHGVPDFPFPERATRALAALHARARQHEGQSDVAPPSGMDFASVRAVVGAARASGRDFLTDERAASVVSAVGVRVPAGALVPDLESALEASSLIGYPVALKIASPDLLHKSDVGGIRIGITTPDELAAAYDEIMGTARAYAPDAVIDGVQVQQMAPNGREVIIGVDRDPVFGPLLMFGLGGIYVEVMRDVTFRLCPVDAAEARRMVSEIRAFGLLRGARGQPTADLDAVIDAIVRVSRLAHEIPSIDELDINPLIVGDAGDGVWAADVRIGIGGM